MSNLDIPTSNDWQLGSLADPTVAEMETNGEGESNMVWSRYQESVEWFFEQCECDFDLLGPDTLPVRTLFVRNASKQTNPSDVKELLSRYGEILKCDVKWVQGYEIKWRGHRLETLVTFTSAYDALRARIDANKMRLVLHNRILELKEADNKYAPWYIQICPSPGMVRLSTESTSNDGDTKIDTLKDDFLIQIFLHLPIVDRIRLERVCKRWRAVSQASWSYVRKLALLKSTWGLSYQSKFKEIDATMLRNVLRRCGSHLKEIHFSPIFEKTYSNPLSDVAEFCPNLRVINASKIPISPVSTELLSRKCQDIRSLSLDKLDGPCDSSLTELFEQFTKLTHFMGCWNLRGECLLHLPRSTIRELVLTDCNKLNFDYLARVLLKFEDLRTFGIYNNRLSTVDLPLEVIEVLSTDCKELKRLEVIGLNLLVPRCKMLITELCNLEVLVLQRTDIDDEFLIELSTKCRNLTRLDISKCYSITWAGIAALASLSKLQRLLVNDTIDCKKSEKWCWHEGWRIEELPHTSDFSSLKHLECRNCYILSPSEICCLIKCSPILELVDLSGYYCKSRMILEELIAHAITRNSKLAFKVNPNAY